ncbi:hypothetical protein KI387_016595, partial [Taxus chinensis]
FQLSLTQISPKISSFMHLAVMIQFLQFWYNKTKKIQSNQFPSLAKAWRTMKQ